MCGIFGSIGEHVSYDKAKNMGDLLNHRGPDDGDIWFDSEHEVCLGHRRLSILDLSIYGKQPMKSGCGRYILTYNGEIYNYLELRNSLRNTGYSFRGNSDTEVLLAACIVWGVKKAISKIEGMFAFGFYDIEKHSLWLARDPMGIKPLYFSISGKKIAFSSDLKPLLSFSWIDKSVNEHALFSYFRYGYIPTPFSILKNISKLKAGHFLFFQKGKNFTQSFWNHEEIAQKENRLISKSFGIIEAADLLQEELTRSVKLHMQSDVPYGAFLSGGIDSSTIVALMQTQTSKPVKTFSIGFTEQQHDESKYARAVARYLGTDHSEIILKPNEAINLLMEVPKFFDEPFADNSAIPTFLVSQFARKSVKVCLSGDGGDELFGGYPRYFWAERIERMRKLSPKISRLAGQVLSLAPKHLIDKFLDPLLGYKFSSSEGLSNRVKRLAKYLTIDRESFYEELTPYWNNPSNLIGQKASNKIGNDNLKFPNFLWSEEMMLIDQKFYLQDNILAKLDRVSMATSLEARVPFLTHLLVELSWRFPTTVKFNKNGDRGKLVLRELLYRYVPKKIIDRPKQGFGLPLNNWLRGPLRDWVESLIDPGSIEDSGLNVNIVRQIWNEQLEGLNRQEMIWTIVMYRQWHQRIMGT